jgi:hypothetical protein
VVALVTRRESTDKPSQMGETLIDQIAGGMTVMSSITPSGAGSQGAGRQRLAPTQTPFFRVMVKGERLTPKPGRADDLSWPRPDAQPQASIEPTAAPAAPAAAKPSDSAQPARNPAKDVVKDKDTVKDKGKTAAGTRPAAARDPGRPAVVPKQ